MGLSLPGSRALLTGASGGIGRALARELHARGAHVVLSARREEVLDALCGELGDRAEALPGDLSDSAEVAALAERAGPVDVLVANAGVPASGAVVDLRPEELDLALDVNLRAPIHLAHALAPGMVARGRGHVVFVSSLSGKVASPRGALYSATKFGLRGFALGLSEDLVGTGVGVTTVFPGFIRDAGMFHDSGTKLPSYVGTRSPEDVARTAADAIERGRLEVDVAPLTLRGAAKLAGLAPGLVAAAQQRAGGRRVSEELTRGHAAKR